MSYTIDFYDTSLGQRWLEALEDNLRQKDTGKKFLFPGFR
jgi:hypothetical protein